MSYRQNSMPCMAVLYGNTIQSGKYTEQSYHCDNDVVNSGMDGATSSGVEPVSS
jgi:hypothetical protein